MNQLLSELRRDLASGAGAAGAGAGAAGAGAGAAGAGAGASGAGAGAAGAAAGASGASSSASALAAAALAFDRVSVLKIVDADDFIENLVGGLGTPLPSNGYDAYTTEVQAPRRASTANKCDIKIEFKSPKFVASTGTLVVAPQRGAAPGRKSAMQELGPSFVVTAGSPLSPKDLRLGKGPGLAFSAALTLIWNTDLLGKDNNVVMPACSYEEGVTRGIDLVKQMMHLILRGMRKAIPSFSLEEDKRPLLLDSWTLFAYREALSGESRKNSFKVQLQQRISDCISRFFGDRAAKVPKPAVLKPAKVPKAAGAARVLKSADAARVPKAAGAARVPKPLKPAAVHMKRKRADESDSEDSGEDDESEDEDDDDETEEDESESEKDESEKDESSEEEDEDAPPRKRNKTDKNAEILNRLRGGPRNKNIEEYESMMMSGGASSQRGSSVQSVKLSVFSGGELSCLVRDVLKTSTPTNNIRTIEKVGSQEAVEPVKPTVSRALPAFPAAAQLSPAPLRLAFQARSALSSPLATLAASSASSAAPLAAPLAPSALPLASSAASSASSAAPLALPSAAPALPSPLASSAVRLGSPAPSASPAALAPSTLAASYAPVKMGVLMRRPRPAASAFFE
jgi:hypothetical protein